MLVSCGLGQHAGARSDLGAAAKGCCAQSASACSSAPPAKTGCGRAHAHAAAGWSSRREQRLCRVSSNPGRLHTHTIQPLPSAIARPPHCGCCSGSSIDTSAPCVEQTASLAPINTRATTTNTQENFAARLAADWQYERALRGLRLLVQHQPGPLAQTLLAWRQGASDELKKAYGGGGGGGSGGGAAGAPGGAAGACKRAAVEIIFMDAADAVLAEFRPAFLEDRHFAAFLDTVQQ
jgi:hypothetical protein